jgi:Cytochrome c554 and c-prime
MAAVLAAQNYIGAGGCASGNCHGGTTPLAEPESRILGNEFATWAVADRHARAYRVLEEARAKRMGEILKLDATRDKRCTVCHVAGSPEKTRSDGVACEACHGPAEKWLGPHTRPDSHAESVRTGMIDTRDPAIRARTCMACHVGAPGQEVDHELIAAGHPDLAFEIDTFTAGQPSHHHEEKTAARLRIWAIGQTTGLAESMKLLAAHEKTWPEYSDLECYQCHHDLRAESWRIQRGYPDRKPGTARINPARIEIVRELVGVAAPDQRAAFETAIARLAGPDGAKAVEAIAATLSDRFANQDIDAPAIVRALAANIVRIADGGPSTAEQATMSLDALAGRPEAVKPLYDYLEHPSVYRPAEFADLFRKAANQ